MRRTVIIAALLATPLASIGASAEEARYTLDKTENGYVRMDTQTGEMSICEEYSGQLVCRLAADERTAFQGDIDRLQTNVASLEQRVAALENSLTAKLESALPSEEEFQKTMSYMERFLRGFMGVVKDLEAEEPARPEAQKT